MNSLATLTVTSSAPFVFGCQPGLFPQTNVDGACFCGKENGPFMCPSYREGTALCIATPGKAMSCGTELFKDNKQEEICPFTAQLLLLEGTSYCQDISTVVNCGKKGDACQAPQNGYATCQSVRDDFECRPHCLTGRVLNVEQDACVYPTKVQARQLPPGPSVSARARARARRDMEEQEQSVSNAFERLLAIRAAPSASSRARAKRLTEASISLDLESQLCPAGEAACATGDNATGDAILSGHYQCLNLKEDMNNCGLCGFQCDKQNGVATSGCTQGLCTAFSCKTGYRLNEDLLAGVSTCISIA